MAKQIKKAAKKVAVKKAAKKKVGVIKKTVLRSPLKKKAVKKPSEQSILNKIHKVKHDVEKKVYPKVELISLNSAVANKEEAAKLQIKEGSPVWRVTNRLSLEGRCVMIDQITLDKKRFKNLTRTDFIDRKGSIYQMYQAQYEQTVVRSSERLRAGLAGKQHAEWLGLTPESPVLIIRRVALGLQDDPIEWRISTLNTNQHEYFSELVV